VDFVRRGIEAGNAANWERASWEPFVHPEARFHTARLWPGPDVYEGHDGFAELISEWQAAFAGFSLRIDQLVDAEGRVVALMHALGTSTSTGLEVEWPIGAIFGDFADDQGPREVRWSTDWSETLSQAGLPALSE